MYDNKQSEKSDATRTVIWMSRNEQCDTTLAKQVAQHIEWVLSDKSQALEPFFVY